MGGDLDFHHFHHLQNLRNPILALYKNTNQKTYLVKKQNHYYTPNSPH